MPGATVGAAYSERKHIESARRNYDSSTKQTYSNAVGTLMNLAELNLDKRTAVSSSLEKKLS